MKICLECNNLFFRDFVSMQGSGCPILNCSGEIVDIDDNILYPITVLNQKGYSTEFSCAGHTWGHDTYLLFSSIVHPNAFQSLPKNFSSEIVNNYNLKIFRSIPEGSVAVRQKCLMESSVALIEWAEKLSYSVYFTAEFILREGADLVDFQKRVEQKLNLEINYLQPEDSFAPKAFFHACTSSESAALLFKQIKAFAKEMSAKVLLSKLE